MQQSSQNQIQEDYNNKPMYQHIHVPQPQLQPQPQPQMATYNPNPFMIPQNPQFIAIIPIQQYQSNHNVPIFDHSPPKPFNDPTISNDESFSQADEIIKQLSDSGKDFAAFLNEICQKSNLKSEYIYNPEPQLK